MEQRTGGKRRLCYSICEHMWSLRGNTKDPFQHVNPALQFRPHQTALQRDFHVSQGSRSCVWKAHSVPRSVPLDPTALMFYIVAPFSTLMPTLSLSPMEVIKRTLFMLDHSTSQSWTLRVPCLMCDSSAGHWRWLRSAWYSQNSLWGLLCNKNQNNDDAKSKLRGEYHMGRAA